MATRRSRLQIKPNIGIKPKGITKSTPISKPNTNDFIKDSKVVSDTKGKSKPNLSVSTPVISNRDGELSPRKNIVLSPLKAAGIPKSPLKESIVQKLNANESHKAENDFISKVENRNEDGLHGKDSGVQVQDKVEEQTKDLQNSSNTGSPLKGAKFKLTSAIKKTNLASSGNENSGKGTEENNELEKDHQQIVEPIKPKQKKTVHKVSIPPDAPLDRTKVKMSDLIFWNPNRNFMKKKTQNKQKATDENKTESKDKLDSSANNLLQATEEEGKEDNPEEEDEDTPMPVPQVKIGPDGCLVLNEESLVIKNKEKEDAETDMAVVDETDCTATYCSFRSKRIRSKWSDKQTAKFYKALQCIGTDFTMMLKVFPKRTRTEIKKKFVKEDRQNRAKIERALREQLPFDLSLFDDDEEEEEEEGIKKKEKKSDKATKVSHMKSETENLVSSYLNKNAVTRPKRTRKKPKGYFESMEDDDIIEAEDEEENCIVKKKPRAKCIKEDLNYAETPVVLTQVLKDSPTLGQLPDPNPGTSIVLSHVPTEQTHVRSGQTHKPSGQTIVPSGQTIISSGQSDGEGPLIFVYNKAEDGSGELVIHVYRLQPDAATPSSLPLTTFQMGHIQGNNNVVQMTTPASSSENPLSMAPVSTTGEQNSVIRTQEVVTDSEQYVHSSIDLNQLTALHQQSSLQNTTNSDIHTPYEMKSHPGVNDASSGVPQNRVTAIYELSEPLTMNSLQVPDDVQEEVEVDNLMVVDHPTGHDYCENTVTIDVNLKREQVIDSLEVIHKDVNR